MVGSQEQVYDIIFAGGGASACITAGRLAAADPTLKILIIEAGPHTRELQDHIQPARYFSNLALTKEVFSFHRAKPSKSLLGRSPIVPSGRAVGGGSAVNFVVYTRAAASDYDDWETKFGNKGWSSEHIIPLLKKAETYQAESTNSTHGTSGPLKVSFAPDLKNVSEDFLQVAEAYDKQRSLTDDANEFSVVDKYAPWARYVDAETGRRSDTAHHYVYNQERNTNLSVLDRHKVVRVIFENKRAVGVQYVSDVIGRSGGVTTLLTARASRLVVLSSGAFGSPAILERSGIGEKSVLEKVGVKVLVDLPGVGEHYLDHYGIFLPFVATEDADTLDPIFHGSDEEITKHAQQWLKEGKGLMTHNSVDSGIKFKPNAEERATMSPEFDHIWKTYYADVPDRPVLLLLPVVAYTGTDPTVPYGKYFSLAYFLGYPVSVGSVHITSGENPYAKSDFHPGYLDEPADLVVLRWGYKKCRELARRMKHYAGDLVNGHPKFKEGSNAATIQSAPPQALSNPDIVYTKEDDDAIDQYHRESDCSISPANVGANTYNTAIAIGEKAAVIIAEDLGGASACITAGRLAAADPSLKILIVEAGPHTREHRDTVQPGRYVSNLARVLTGETETFSVHVGKPSQSLLGRSPIVLSANAVGGGSSVNFMVYTRGSASDYDDWEIEHGNIGWGSRHLIPLLKKAETYQPETTNNTHGTSGPLKISYPAPGLINVASNVLEVAAAYDHRRSLTDDLNAFYECNKYGTAGRYIDGKTGRRSDTAHYYIYNQATNTNLTVVDRHRVVRVILEGNRAVGIEYVEEVSGRKGGPITPIVARAKHLVVIAAGTLGSSAILERSGIGGKAVLEKAGIQTVVDLPGVGENYMDHNLMFLQFKATPDADTMDGIFRGDEEEIKTHEKKWLEDGQGLMAHNGLNCGIKIRPAEDELASMSPEFDHRWQTYYASANHQDKSVSLIGFMAAYGGATPDVPFGKYFSFVYFSAYPASVGKIHVTSGSDPYASSDFHPGFLDDPADVAVLRYSYKRARELARRMKYYAGDVVAAHPNYKESSNAKPNESTTPVGLSEPDIMYSKEDDEAIDEHHRRRVETAWHSIGTCAMKPRERGGVVDARLNVYGVQGLKVADCSIAPGNVGANMYNTAIAIGEKAAVIIAQDLGIEGVTEA
ncbi:hypothetical protein CVT25_012854 [Psilocybe cyanescens]|uniref:pyranose dehydrogenase (acceptor) n=1 Tax=Psilocybe cyanescens TaxID=93625 RepID=A0A409XLR1_PSICY|nr:hypothetical protein CVT25_012854 [Psilocybe cyanescens]